MTAKFLYNGRMAVWDASVDPPRRLANLRVENLRKIDRIPWIAIFSTADMALAHDLRIGRYLDLEIRYHRSEFFAYDDGDLVFLISVGDIQTEEFEWLTITAPDQRDVVNYRVSLSCNCVPDLKEIVTDD